MLARRCFQDLQSFPSLIDGSDCRDECVLKEGTSVQRSLREQFEKAARSDSNARAYWKCVSMLRTIGVNRKRLSS